MEKNILIQCRNTILMKHNTNPNNCTVVGVFLIKKIVTINIFQGKIQISTYNYTDLLFSLRVPFDADTLFFFSSLKTYKNYR